MNQGNHSADKLYRHVKKNGTKSLLPQNLTDELLDKMNLEADAINEDRTEEAAASTLLMAVLCLANGSKISKKMEIKIDSELLMEYFDLYILSLRFEDMRRKKDIDMSSESLPTLKNIFDPARTMDITWSK